jgi:hypothetical protein
MEVQHIDGLVGKAYNSVRMFNNIANNIGNNTQQTLRERLLNQIKIIQSELNEFKLGVETNDPLETLDGVGDLFVTAAGALQMVDEVSRAREALLEICDNNLSKFIQISNPNAQQIIQDSVKYYAEKGLHVVAELNSTFGVYVLKDQDGKVRKPTNYKSVDLVSYL